MVRSRRNVGSVMAEVINESSFAYESLHVQDERGVPVFVPLVQATYAILEVGRLGLLKQQPPINVAGEWHGDPATSSLRREPEIAFTKLTTDVVLRGHAYPSRHGGCEGEVGIRVGSVQKVARVFGDRRLNISRSRASIAPPQPFESIPLIYERSFGGWDRRHDNPERHRCEPRNPVGVGFHDASLGPIDGAPLPNFEDPTQLYRADGETPPPVGFGFVPTAWQPRVAYGGTYDKIWDSTRKPLLPADFDRRFFNGASPGLIAPGYLRGDEDVIVIGMAREGRVRFELPGIAPPCCLVEKRVGAPVMLQGVLDTVIVDMDERTVAMLWRAHLCLRGGPHDVVSVEVAPVPDADAPDDDMQEELS
jgi:hypothetical protein